MTEHENEAQRSIGVITYDAPHLKTEQIVHRLLARGQRNLTLLTLPFVDRPEREVMIRHRPRQSEAVATRDLAAANGLALQEIDGKSPLPPLDIFLITGAGILAPEVVRDRKILNVHPGIIPSARGLDAFKWSIHAGIELGVTLHFIDDQVDSGEVVAIARTPVYATDSLASLARRHYELELDLMVDFEDHLADRSVDQFPQMDARKRMPATVEAETIRRFDAYKEKFARRPAP